jgi:hypothetical protein
MMEPTCANDMILVRHRLLAKGIGGGVETATAAVFSADRRFLADRALKHQKPFCHQGEGMRQQQIFPLLRKYAISHDRKPLREALRRLRVDEPLPPSFRQNRTSMNSMSARNWGQGLLLNVAS